MATQNASLTLSRSPRPGKKYFDIDEANRALTYLKPITRDLMTCYQQVVCIRRHIEHPDSTDQRETLEADYEAAMDRLSALVDELHQVGVELKDFERGLIDFPAIHAGREIYLCWEYGEPQLTAWHETDAGYGGRQNINQLLQHEHEQAA